jgi:hypothetical protein
MVEEYGLEKHGYDRTKTRDYFLENYDKLFGRLRPKAKEVPSDEFRKYLMVFQLLHLIDGRRAEYAQERAGTLRTRISNRRSDVNRGLMTATGESDTLPSLYFLGNRMTDPKLEASKHFRQEQPASTYSEYEREQEAIRKNRKRLKAERLAREAS